MLRGDAADTAAHTAAAEALETYLVTVADHGLNASTFTARVVASTRAGMVSTVTAALCALKGPLHGGAPGPVLDMLDEIGEPDGARPWLENQFAAGNRLMGFGHRVYRTRDPRADALKGVVAELRNYRSGQRRAARTELPWRRRWRPPSWPTGGPLPGPVPGYQRGILHRPGPRSRRSAARIVHLGLRHGPGIGLDGVYFRAGTVRAPDPPGLALRPPLARRPHGDGHSGLTRPVRAIVRQLFLAGVRDCRPDRPGPGVPMAPAGGGRPSPGRFPGWPCRRRNPATGR